MEEWLLIGLLVLFGGVIAGGALLANRYLSHPNDSFTWFLLHFAIGAMGILAVIILAVVHALNAAAATIVSGIVAYSLGASSGKLSPQSTTLSQDPTSSRSASINS